MVGGHVVEAVFAAGFLVSHEQHPVVHGRQQFLGGDGPAKQDGADHGLLIVLDAAPVDEIAVDGQGIGIGLPQGAVAGRHDVQVGDDPEGARGVGPGHDHGEVWPVAAGHAGIGSVYFADFGKAHAGQQDFETIGFFAFAGAAVVGAQGGDGGHFALQVDDGLAFAVDMGQQVV